MIVLHNGETAKSRIEQIAQSAEGAVYKNDPTVKISDIIDQLSDWLAKTSSPEAIVIEQSGEPDDDDREAYSTLRRIAKFKGVDVHLVGSSWIETIADRVVNSDEELELTAPGSSVGSQVASLVQSETMTGFERVEMDVPTWQEVQKTSGCTEQEAKDRINWMKSQSVWANNLYQVNIEFMPENRAHLIIRRLDKQPIHNWQHFQEIKNALLGPECEAVEIYPKESQLVDEKHHYHLWGFRSPKNSFGIGFRVGRQTK